MENIILIDVGNDISETQIKWAAESAKEFLSLFPQHKDKIKIQIRKGDEIFDTNGQKIRDAETIQNKENDLRYRVSYTNGSYSFTPDIPKQLYPNGCLENAINKNVFDVIDNGDSYKFLWKKRNSLFPTSFKQLEKDLLMKDNRGEFIDTNFFSAFNEFYKHAEQQKGRRILTTINLTKHQFLYVNPAMHSVKGAYGVTTYGDRPFVTLNVDNIGNNQQFLRNVLCHELGHAFGATPNGRQGMIDAGGGDHCPNKGCLMEDYFAGNYLNKNLPLEQYFCNDCKTLMNKYMNFILNENTNSTSNNLTLTDDENNLPPNQEQDDSFKAPWQAFAVRVQKALGDGAALDVDNTSPNFKATIKKTDGSTTSIVASSANNVSLGAQKADGTPDIPDQKVFDELAKKALRDGSDINFGDIKDNEFKARLMIACQAAGVKMIGAPEINKEFLDSLDKTSRDKLAPAKNPATPTQVSVSQSNQPTPRR